MSEIEQRAGGMAGAAVSDLEIGPAQRGDGDRGTRYLPLISIASIVAVFVVWWLLTSGLGIVASLRFPSPQEVWRAVDTLRGQLVRDAVATLTRVLASWALGSALGVLVGLVMVRSRKLFYALSPVIEGLRPVPPVALIPFVIVWFGIGDSGKVFLGALGCFMVMVVNAIVASGHVAPNYVRAARALGASENQIYRTVVLPAIVPQLVSGLRIGAALAFGTVVAAEFIGAEDGIGARIMLASRTLDTGVVLLGTIVIGALAFAVDQAIKALSARATRWAERTTD